MHSCHQDLDAERLLEKKLGRVFQFLDEDTARARAPCDSVIGCASAQNSAAHQFVGRQRPFHGGSRAASFRSIGRQRKAPRPRSAPPRAGIPPRGVRRWERAPRRRSRWRRAAGGPRGATTSQRGSCSPATASATCAPHQFARGCRPDEIEDVAGIGTSLARIRRRPKAMTSPLCRHSGAHCGNVD